MERKQKRLTEQTPTFINKIRFEVALYKLLLLYRSINVVIGVWCICRLNWFNVVLEAKVLNEHGFRLSVWIHPVCPFAIFTSFQIVQGPANVGGPDLVNFITSVAYHFCLALLAAFT